MTGDQMRKIALIAILLLILTCVGCYKNVKGPSFAPTVVGQGWDWGDDTNLNSRFESSPVKIKDYYYLTSMDGRIYKFDIAKGKQDKTKPWPFFYAQGIRSTPAVYNDVLYFGGFDQKLHALDPASGQEIFTFQTQGYIASSPVISGNVIYFGCYDGKFRAINLDNRKLVWGYDSKSRIRGGASASARGIAFGNEKGVLTYLDLNSGSVIWTFEGKGEIFGAPAITSDLMIFGSRDGEIRAVNEIDGSLNWEFIPPTDSQPYKEEFWCTPAVDDIAAYVGSTIGKFYALRLHPSGTSPELLWEPFVTQALVGEKTYLADYIYSDATVSGDSVLFGCNNGILFCIDRFKGTELWHFLSFGEIRSKPIIDGDKVIFPSNDHYLYALTLSDGQPVRGK
jgi:eukaryotic-like serine/threonine-protein kinase